MSFSIRIRKQALKEIEKLPSKNSIEISKAIDSLSFEPRPVGCKKLKGQSETIWRIKLEIFAFYILLKTK